MCKTRQCKIGPQVVNFNGDEPVFFPYSIETIKCSGSRNTINSRHAKICFPDLVKNLMLKYLI